MLSRGHYLLPLALSLLLTLYHFRFNATSADNALFSIQAIPHKGQGMIANTNLAAGTRLIKEKALLKLPAQSEYHMRQVVDDLQQQFRFLNVTEKKTLLALSNFKSSDSKIHHLLGIFQTNSMRAGERSSGVFPTAARMNHGCAGAANAVYHYRTNEDLLTVYTLRDIRKGEEILCNYFDTKKPRKERREHLHAQYGFHCHCSVCDISDAAKQQESDRDLSRLANLHNQLMDWSNSAISGARAISIVLDMLAILDKHNYASERARIYMTATHIAAAHSDETAVHMFALQSYKEFRKTLGEDAVETQSMLSIQAIPSKHLEWAAREKEQVVQTTT